MYRFTSSFQQNVGGIDQIGVDIRDPNGVRLTADVLVFEDYFFADIVQGKADNHAMNRGHAAGIVAPLKSTMREMNCSAAC